MCDLVGNPENKFSHNEAHIVSVVEQVNFGTHLVGNTEERCINAGYFKVKNHEDKLRLGDRITFDCPFIGATGGPAVGPLLIQSDQSITLLSLRGRKLGLKLCQPTVTLTEKKRILNKCHSFFGI